MVTAYGDHRDDGLLQLHFTLPVSSNIAGREAARCLAGALGLTRIEIVHAERLTNEFTFFIVSARTKATVPYLPEQAGGQRKLRTRMELSADVLTLLGRRLVVLGASTGTDTHSVGIDAMLNMKGFGGEAGLEAYPCFRVYNLGSQVDNTTLAAAALELQADVVLVSQTVTQQDLHLRNLTELVEILEAMDLRQRVMLVCGGPRITDELAKELGYDAGFSRGTVPSELADYIAQELSVRWQGDAPAPPED